MRPTSFASILARLMAISAGHRWLIPVLVALGLTAFLFEGIGIYLLMPLLQTLGGEGAGSGDPSNPLIAFANSLTDGFDPDTRVVVLVAAIVACILMKGITALASQIAYSYAGARFGHGVRQETFRAILRADQSFLDRQPPGALLNTLATETWRLSQGLQALSYLILNGCAVVIFLGLMLALSWQTTLAVGVGVAVILGIVQIVTAPARAAGEAAVRANQELASRISEGLAGQRTIRLFARETDEIGRFAQASDAVRRQFLRLEAINAVPGPLLEVLFAALLGALLIGREAGGLSDLIVFLALLLRLRPHAAALMHARVAILTLGGALDNVIATGEGAARQTVASGDLPAPAPEREIALNDVSFHYPGAGMAALDHASFVMPARETTAIVGPSGAGKSTLLNLICRLGDPTGGAVLIDGQDLRSFDIVSWRRRIAVVPQDVFLFNTTIRQNIAYGRPDATDDEIRAAARAAYADDFIAAQPQGYDTVVGDRGVRFSGGQRQRMALARAFLAEPDILILDEATNALDGTSERFVQDALREQSGRFTVIVVAHRLSSIDTADHVVVLDKGRVSETGTPGALMARGGLFAEMFARERLSA